MLQRDGRDKRPVVLSLEAAALAVLARVVPEWRAESPEG
jgi:hypothetical protein